MADETLTCSDCRKPFLFTDNEAKFFAEKGLFKPRRCKPCRDTRKAAKNAAAPQPLEHNEHAKREVTRLPIWTNGTGGEPDRRRRDGSKRPRRLYEQDDNS